MYSYSVLQRTFKHITNIQQINMYTVYILQLFPQTINKVQQMSIQCKELGTRDNGRVNTVHWYEIKKMSSHYGYKWCQNYLDTRGLNIFRSLTCDRSHVVALSQMNCREPSFVNNTYICVVAWLLLQEYQCFCTESLQCCKTRIQKIDLCAVAEPCNNWSTLGVKMMAISLLVPVSFGSGIFW